MGMCPVSCKFQSSEHIRWTTAGILPSPIAKGCTVIMAHSGSVNRWPPMTSANGYSSLTLRTENSVFLAPESPFYTYCVRFLVCYIFRSTAQRGHGPSGPMVNTPMSDTLLASLRCRKKALHLSRFFSFTVDPISLGSKNNKFRARAKFKGNLSIIFCTNYKLNYIIFLCSFKIP